MLESNIYRGDAKVGDHQNHLHYHNAEKNELLDEKQRLKMEKEKLERQLNSMNLQPTFIAPPPPAMPAAYAAAAAQRQVGNKLVPVISYPGMGMAMWQVMPPAVVDTSQCHVLHPPPVA